jgi:ATP-dependent exoDNAse (exonuclease V) alpha subunit
MRTNEAGRVYLRAEDGKRTSFRPDRLDPLDTRDTISLSERDTLRIHEGDKIVWTANDKARSIHNSEAARILSISQDGVEALTASGEKIFLPAGDKMIERLNLAYAINMHQAQGMTSDLGIGVMHSAERQLSNQRLTHVMATRVRDDITIFTNDRDQLLKSIEANPGDKASALEHIGEKAMSRSPATPVPEQASPTDKSAPGSAVPSPAPPEPAWAAPTRNIPEKVIELGL